MRKNFSSLVYLVYLHCRLPLASSDILGSASRKKHRALSLPGNRSDDLLQRWSCLSCLATHICLNLYSPDTFGSRPALYLKLTGRTFSFAPKVSSWCFGSVSNVASKNSKNPSRFDRKKSCWGTQGKTRKQNVFDRKKPRFKTFKKNEKNVWFLQTTGKISRSRSCWVHLGSFGDPYKLSTTQ